MTDNQNSNEISWICYVCGQETDTLEGCVVESEEKDPVDGWIVTNTKNEWLCEQCYDEYKDKEKTSPDGVLFFKESDLKITPKESDRYKYEILDVISEIIGDVSGSGDLINKNKIVWLRWRVDNWKVSNLPFMVDVEEKILELAKVSLNLYNNKGK